MSLPFLKEVLDIQKEYPRAGRFRVRGLLEQQREGGELPSEATVGRAMALNRQFHGAPGPWQSQKGEIESDTIPKYLLYRPHYRHEFWFIDVRYLVKLEDQRTYSICIIEGYSRTILAGTASEHQDLTIVLQILFAALTEYGCPEVIVSDNAAVFKAHHFLAILDGLDIKPQYIEKGKPWQNLIEAQFKVQLRLADFKFEQATSFQEVQQLHVQFIDTFNTTPHWAHQEREDGRRTPAQVLAWVRGQLVEPARLHRLFWYVQFTRTVSQPTLYRTPFVSPQLEIFELDEAQWLKVRQRSYQRQQKRLTRMAKQLPLTDLQVAV